ncbi:hypothetical protein PPYR_10538 [Photinus pyralis]|uniref:RNase H type-1 domain-containing protein n=1 Tax=Photinus pyralis TaxID=7054 RepID=A0A5N4AGM5_PHOPY|nr:hypothetical protein PPYR_10538 [Photinus pyralis]
MVVDGVVHSWALNPITSVYTAEQFALWKALVHIPVEPTNKTYLIVSDSLNAINAVKDIYTRDPLARLCQGCLVDLSEHNVRPVFVWVPGHSGINGNEMVDRAAKIAITGPRIDEEHVKMTDVQCHLKQKIIEIWQGKWERQSTSLSHVKLSVKEKLYLKDFRRDEQIKIHRLRLGHTNVTHQYLLTGDPRPRCNTCNVDLSVKHVICDCVKYVNQRDRFNLKEDVRSNLNEIPNLKNVLKFLKAIGIYSNV